MEKVRHVVSVVVPCYNEAENIPLLVSELQDVLKDYVYEIILVDDGSTDQSGRIYEQLCLDQRTLHFIRFSVSTPLSTSFLIYLFALLL